ncbi:MAG TPA: hypothetical protein VKC60_02345 [Opitutaceae bacterium]|nr:hypothetical protein [Opitutaceae bacterium]
MSTRAIPVPGALPAESPSAKANVALGIGAAGIVVTAIGLFFQGGVQKVSASWLFGLSCWTALTIGMLLLVLIHHILDAGWSTVIRRQWEHGLAAFKWLGILFIPLLVAAWYSHTHEVDILWPWVNPAHAAHGGHPVSEDILYVKKSAFLNTNMLVFGTILYFAAWSWLSARLRRASFSQDLDGDIKWTFMNRKTAAFGLPITALTLTAAAIHWIKSLEYHWFSTMYGVWFFANCMRAAYSVGLLMMLWLYRRGDYKGILNKNHLHSIGQMMLAFTIFWAYVTFSQYFLIWNANVPEETFWYVIRETGDWWYVGLLILFGHFVVPFLFLLSYKNKITHSRIKFIAIWILCIIAIDLYYNIMPFKKDEHGDPISFLSSLSLWDVTAFVGVGGVWLWSYLKSFATTKLIPIRDPRIAESLTYHE